ncbi:ATP-binding protein [Brevundimonas lenta]|uniref:ATP-binding protein n=1 Tax=Brevundimonas lenta TaxID=424796 RepID=UPI001FE57EFD|nr:ATP-binding protein [Brevundimonas lenta]
MHLAADWASRNGRRLLALTVDHGLNPDSPRWNDLAARAAAGAGADWRLLHWTGPHPATGLPAAARAARHRLIADAARAAGARVVLFAHTADDVAEGELMRADGSSLGRLRAWSPSPVWPEGRGLMLLRPLLDVRRQDLRDWLRARDAAWIDDPANDDPRFARSRARRALAGTSPPPTALAAPATARGLLAVEDDVIRLSRHADARTLAAALVCAGGGERPPRGDRLAHALTRLRSGEDFTAALSGARLEAAGDRVLVLREPGEYRRHATPPVPLPQGLETVWDGRWALTAPQSGWVAVPAAGRLNQLSDADRAVLSALPPAARAARPVLIRNDATAPVLAGDAHKAQALVAQRLASALDGMTHETDLGAFTHGATPWKHLFSSADIRE